MKILDCESENSTYESLFKIVGLKRGKFQTKIKHLDLDLFHYKSLVEILEIKEISNIKFDSVCWVPCNSNCPDESF